MIFALEQSASEIRCGDNGVGAGLQVGLPPPLTTGEGQLEEGGENEAISSRISSSYCFFIIRHQYPRWILGRAG